ncbi:MAG: 5-methyltetrahydropteroyltriglutamate--homocysteine S-methyltransferase [Alphaproteobacteria bacterium]|jgi:5-methyltetrahydropteroyltriglutamate--homocysteine methyltransferase
MPRKLSPPYRADHVGSLLRPERLKEAREAAGFAMGATPDERGPHTMSLEDLHAIEDACIRESVSMLQEAGIKTITDGEFRRGSWAYDLLGAIDGIELRRAQANKDATFTSGVQPPVAHAVGRVKRPDGGLVLNDYLYLDSLGAEGTIKVTMPSPTMMYVRGGRESVDATVYPDIEEYFEDVTGVYRDEIAALAAAGCKYVQIDNTDAAYICDPKFQAKAREQGMEPEEQIALQGRLISMATRGRPDDVAVSMHICRGNSAGAWIASGGYDFIAETLFTQFDVDAFFLEFDSERAGDFSPLRYASGDQLLVLGLVTTKTPENYSKDELLSRIEEASKYVSLDALALSPQCGFASVARGNPISFDDQRRKFDLILEVADEVWGTA